MPPKTEFKYLCRIFLFLGQTSVQSFFRKKSRYHNLLLCIPVVVQAISIILELIWLQFYTNELYNPKYHPNSNVRAIADAVQFRYISIYSQSIGLLIVATIQIIENICKSDIDQKIKDSIALFDQEMFAKHFCCNSCSFCNKRSLKTFFGQTVVIFVIWLIMDIAVLLTINDEEAFWRKCICVREFSSNMIRIGMIQVLLHFHWVR